MICSTSHGDAATVGKAVAKDEDAGKATLVGLIGVDAVRERLGEFQAKALDALAPFGDGCRTARRRRRVRREPEALTCRACI